jgi:hypothetical protein
MPTLEQTSIRAVTVTLAVSSYDAVFFVIIQGC